VAASKLTPVTKDKVKAKAFKDKAIKIKRT
jgi:hypothetical protein